MTGSKNIVALRETIFRRITEYSGKVTPLGQKVRHRVFGFRQRSTAHIDRWALPVKILHDHRLPQRQRAFRQAGGNRSSIAAYALKKARQNQQF